MDVSTAVLGYMLHVHIYPISNLNEKESLENTAWLGLIILFQSLTRMQQQQPSFDIETAIYILGGFQTTYRRKINKRLIDPNPVVIAISAFKTNVEERTRWSVWFSSKRRSNDRLKSPNYCRKWEMFLDSITTMNNKRLLTFCCCLFPRSRRQVHSSRYRLTPLPTRQFILL